MNRALRSSLLAPAILLSLGLGATLQAQQGGSPGSDMTFFVTSAGSGKGADLGGLEGADRHCQELAQAAGAGGHAWRAYLSTQASDSQPAVNARDRMAVGRGGTPRVW
jgi:hypothetical protein